MPGFDLIDQIGLGGFRDRPNEDRAGLAGPHAFVIDGATGLGQPFMPGSSDAAWLAQRAADFLAGEGRLLAHEALWPALARSLIAAFEAERTRSLEARWELPCGAFMLATALDRGLLLSWVGDCRAIVAVDGGALMTFGATPASEADEARLVAQLAGAGGDPAARYRDPAALAALRAGRAEALAEGASQILSPDMGFVRQIRTAHVAADAADILLMTDGFAAAELRYGLYDDPRRLLEDARAHGLAHVGAALRRFERETDPDGVLKPRWKRSDDATALWLRLAT